MHAHELAGGRVDVAVAGAGPVGCVAAIAFARRGARVALLEARPEAALQRLAGEWLHPPAVRVLESLGVAPPLYASDHARGGGFVVFPEDRSEPIVLPYADGGASLACEHALLVRTLRDAALAQPNIAFLAPATLQTVEDGRVVYHQDGARQALEASLVVGADGRSSRVRAALGDPAETHVTSLMAGLVLEDAVLPFEGYGHVVLGGPGPALIMRIGVRRIRVCLDVPAAVAQPEARTPEALHAAFAHVLPPSLVPAFGTALRERAVAWNANRIAPRDHTGSAGVALVGDAVGHFHPMTAAGMTVGFLDAMALAASGSVAEYRRARGEDARVAELLAEALYGALQRQDLGTSALRRGIYRLWREDDVERRRTMRLLSGDEIAGSVFRQTFLKVLQLAARSAVFENASPHEWRRLVRTFGSLGAWVKWPLAAAFRDVRPAAGDS